MDYSQFLVCSDRIRKRAAAEGADEINWDDALRPSAKNLPGDDDEISLEDVMRPSPKPTVQAVARQTSSDRHESVPSAFTGTLDEWKNLSPEARKRYLGGRPDAYYRPEIFEDESGAAPDGLEVDEDFTEDFVEGTPNNGPTTTAISWDKEDQGQGRGYAYPGFFKGLYAWLGDRFVPYMQGRPRNGGAPEINQSFHEKPLFALKDIFEPWRVFSQHKGWKDPLSGKYDNMPVSRLGTVVGGMFGAAESGITSAICDDAIPFLAAIGDGWYNSLRGLKARLSGEDKPDFKTPLTDAAVKPAHEYSQHVKEGYRDKLTEELPSAGNAFGVGSGSVEAATAVGLLYKFLTGFGARSLQPLQPLDITKGTVKLADAAAKAGKGGKLVANYAMAMKPIVESKGLVNTIKVLSNGSMLFPYVDYITESTADAPGDTQARTAVNHIVQNVMPTLPLVLSPASRIAAAVLGAQSPGMRQSRAMGWANILMNHAEALGKDSYLGYGIVGDALVAASAAAGGTTAAAAYAKAKGKYVLDPVTQSAGDIAQTHMGRTIVTRADGKQVNLLQAFDDIGSGDQARIKPYLGAMATDKIAEAYGYGKLQRYLREKAGCDLPNLSEVLSNLGINTTDKVKVHYEPAKTTDLPVIVGLGKKIYGYSVDSNWLLRRVLDRSLESPDIANGMYGKGARAMQLVPKILDLLQSREYQKLKELYNNNKEDVKIAMNYLRMFSNALPDSTPPPATPPTAAPGAQVPPVR